jgi:hypothetical protein
MSQAHFDTLIAAAAKIKSFDNRKAVTYILNQAFGNADSTVFEEKAAPASDWDCIFVGSIGVILSGNEYNRYVVSFFTTRGINY